MVTVQPNAADPSTAVSARTGDGEPLTAMMAKRCELVLDLLNYDALRRELVDSLDRSRRELRREEGILSRMEERYLAAARARDVFVVWGSQPTDDTPESAAQMRQTVSRMSAEASLACLELNTYRNQVNYLAERIALIGNRLSEIDREIAGRRRILRRMIAGTPGASEFPVSLIDPRSFRSTRA